MKWFKLTLVVTCMIALIGCHDNGAGPDFKTSYATTFQQNAAIKADTVHRKMSSDSVVILYQLSINSGKNYIFRHRKSTVPANKDIQDGVSDQTLIFQVPDSVKKFDYSSRDFAAAHVYFRVATIGTSLAYKVEDGVLRGNKTAKESWKIHADVTIDRFADTMKVKFDKTFHEQKLR